MTGPPVPFSVTKHVIGDGKVRLAVSGEIEMSTTDVLAGIIANTLSVDQLTELVVDLDAVTFLDSTGISTLVQGRHDAVEHGVAYRVSNPHGLVLQVLHATGMLGFLTGENDGLT